MLLLGLHFSCAGISQVAPDMADVVRPGNGLPAGLTLRPRRGVAHYSGPNRKHFHGPNSKNSYGTLYF